MSEVKIISWNFAPQGWAFCNGQFLPINQNQALFSLLGTMYGGNGQTTFALPDLRGVRGEMVVVRSPDVSLQRPVRMLHPRMPLYIVPRGNGLFMIGATMIESERRGPVSVRSAVELLNAAYALHPAFGEAEIVELGADLRPAFPDNLPRIAIDGERIGVNGLYRHGFLIAPALAELTLGYVERGMIDNEVMQCA